MFESRISAWATEKLPGWEKFTIKSFCMVLRCGSTCTKMRGTVLWTGQQKDRGNSIMFLVLAWTITKYANKNWENTGELSQVCSHIVSKCLYLARSGRPDILWSVNKLARSVTKWSQPCDRRLARLISNIHHTSDYRQYCHVGNAAQHCRSVLYQDSDFAGDLEDSKSTPGGFCAIFGSETFVPSVQKANLSVSQLYRIWNDFAGCWFANGRFARAGAIGSGDRSIHSDARNLQANPSMQRETACFPRKSNQDWSKWRMLSSQTLIKFLRTHNILKRNHSCTFLKTTKLW